MSLVTASIVPKKYDVDPGLAQSVKKQRVSYKRKHEGKQSGLTDDREQLLNEVVFVGGGTNAKSGAKTI